MPMTHYPKTCDNLVFAWVQPAPPDVPPTQDLPDFLGCPFSELNLFDEAIAPGKSVFAHHDAIPFTRFYGSVACDQPLEINLSFSNEEVTPDGHLVTDANLDKLNYDAEALKQFYDPTKQGPTGKFFVTIFGRYLRVEIKNTGTEPTNILRAFVRGSVF